MKTNSCSIIIFTGILLTAGFTDFLFKEDALSETKSYVSSVKASVKPNPEISGLETMMLTPYVPYRLKKLNEEDPFVVKAFVNELGQDQQADSDMCKSDDCGDGPPIPHAPYLLESYSLDQLMMTGTLTTPGKGQVALIQTPDSGVVYAAVGEYMGRNNGLILSINREGVIIREKYRSPQGWQDRMATLPLNRN